MRSRRCTRWEPGTFTKVETGHVDNFELKPKESGRRYLEDRIEAGGTVLVIAVPDEEEVAATSFGLRGSACRPSTRSRPDLMRVDRSCGTNSHVRVGKVFSRIFFAVDPGT
jgi:hypothetical protein